MQKTYFVICAQLKNNPKVYINLENLLTYLFRIFQNYLIMYIEYLLRGVL